MTDVLIAIRDGSPLIGAPDVSGHDHFGTCIVTLGHAKFGTVTSGQARFGTALFKVTMYRQFAWKVGTSANNIGSNSLLLTPFVTV